MPGVNHILRSLDETCRFGQALAVSMTRILPGALLLYGDLGAGKTALTRFVVEALPGGGDAEISSPSFTICNIYCTAPLVHHFDLYRLEPGSSDEALGESLDDASILTIVEWPERMAARDLPEDGLNCRLTALEAEQGRMAALSALGPIGDRCLALFRSLFSPSYSAVQDNITR